MELDTGIQEEARCKHLNETTLSATSLDRQEALWLGIKIQKSLPWAKYHLIGKNCRVEYNNLKLD